MNITDKNIGEILRNHRILNDMTQSEVAEEIGINRSTLCKYEQGERIPDIRVVSKLLNLYGVGLLLHSR